MRRALRVIALLCGGLVALVATAYVVHGLVGLRQVAAAKEQAAADLDRALATARPESVAEHQRVAARFGPPAYSWQEVVCDLSTNDAGWIVNDYVQECSLRVLSVVEARDASTGCRQLAAPQGAGRSTTVTTWSGPASALGSDDYVSGCPSGLLSPGPRSASRLLDGTRPDSLSSSPSWIVVEARTSLTDSVLGCDPWGVLFCTSPVDEPVLGG